MELVEKIKKFAEEGKDWERRPTTLRGIFLLKLPGTRSSPPRVVVEANPVDETGAPMKKRGIILRSSRELQAFREIFSNEKLDKLMEAIEEAASTGRAPERKEEEVFEI